MKISEKVCAIMARAAADKEISDDNLLTMLNGIKEAPKGDETDDFVEAIRGYGERNKKQEGKPKYSSSLKETLFG